MELVCFYYIAYVLVSSPLYTLNKGFDIYQKNFAVHAIPIPTASFATLISAPFSKRISILFSVRISILFGNTAKTYNTLKRTIELYNFT